MGSLAWLRTEGGGWPGHLRPHAATDPSGPRKGAAPCSRGPHWYAVANGIMRALAPPEKRIGGLVLAGGGLAEGQVGPAPNAAGLLELRAGLQRHAAHGEGCLAPDQDAEGKTFVCRMIRL